MANATPSRLGQIAGAGDTLALFLKVFSGDVLTTFNRTTVYRDRHTVRTIASGKQAQFPVTGRITSYTHVPGQELLGNTILNAERLINIEGLQVAPAFLASIDEAMAHFDYRSIIANDISQALANGYDQDVGRVFALAARTATPNVSDGFGGGVLTVTNYASDGPTLFNGILDAGVQLDSKDVPKEGRFITVDPIRGSLLLRSEKPIDRRLNAGDNLGGYAQGYVVMIDGQPIIITNNYPKADDRTNAGLPTARKKDYSTSQALIVHPTAAGTVEMMGVAMEGFWDPRRQGYMMLGKMLNGHDYLRPESAFELQSAAPAA